MNILFAGHKARGVQCLRALLNAGHRVVAVLVHAGAAGDGSPEESVATAGRALGLPVFAPRDVNAPDVLATLREFAPDLTVLAGYGPIVQPPFIDLARRGAINLHGGKLPQYRGSSPMNWALINGERDFSISVVRVDRGVDTGDVLLERTFPIGPDQTIADLHRIANDSFPQMLLEIIRQIEQGSVRPRRQDERLAVYYPLRFPEDGLILWDGCTAEQVHNRIRALADPYPGAFTWWNGIKVKLLRSQLAARVWRGEPGRVYQKQARGLLVCAADRCLWIERAVCEESGEDALALVQRYDKFATLRDLAVHAASGRVLRV